MMKKYWLIGALLLSVFSTANAVTVSVNDWSYISGTGDTGNTLFRVTETFTSASELGGSDNLYEYSIENFTADLTASLFRVANPDNSARTMNSVGTWSERSGVPNFIWETSDASEFLTPGQTISGFQLYTPDIQPDLSFADYGLNGVGWIMATNAAGARVDIYGEVIRSTVSAPASVLLMSLGLLALVGSRKKSTN